MPFSPMEKTFLRQNYFVWQGKAYERIEIHVPRISNLSTRCLCQRLSDGQGMMEIFIYISIERLIESKKIQSFFSKKEISKKWKVKIRRNTTKRPYCFLPHFESYWGPIFVPRFSLKIEFFCSVKICELGSEDKASDGIIKSLPFKTDSIYSCPNNSHQCRSWNYPLFFFPLFFSFK